MGGCVDGWLGVVGGARCWWVIGGILVCKPISVFSLGLKLDSKIEQKYG